VARTETAKPGSASRASMRRGSQMVAERLMVVT
jgi:hypothetical protein